MAGRFSGSIVVRFNILPPSPLPTLNLKQSWFQHSRMNNLFPRHIFDTKYCLLITSPTKVLTRYKIFVASLNLKSIPARLYEKVARRSLRWASKLRNSSMIKQCIWNDDWITHMFLWITSRVLTMAKYVSISIRKWKIWKKSQAGPTCFVKGLISFQGEEILFQGYQIKMVAFPRMWEGKLEAPIHIHICSTVNMEKTPTSAVMSKRNVSNIPISKIHLRAP